MIGDIAASILVGLTGGATFVATAEVAWRIRNRLVNRRRKGEK